MDYPCGKFSFILWTDRNTDATKCFTPETVVGVSNYHKTRFVNKRTVLYL